MGFQGEEGIPRRLDVVGTKPHQREDLVARTVEQHVVVGHVEMAVVVDPVWLDTHLAGGEGGPEKSSRFTLAVLISRP